MQEAVIWSGYKLSTCTTTWGQYGTTKWSETTESDIQDATYAVMYLIPGVTNIAQNAGDTPQVVVTDFYSVAEETRAGLSRPGTYDVSMRLVPAEVLTAVTTVNPGLDEGWGGWWSQRLLYEASTSSPKERRWFILERPGSEAGFSSATDTPSRMYLPSEVASFSESVAQEDAASATMSLNLLTAPYWSAEVTP